MEFLLDDTDEGEHFYLDGEALSKLFSPQLGSELLDRIALRKANVLYVSDTGVLEAKALIATRLSEGRLAPERFGDVLSRMDRFLTQWEGDGKVIFLTPDKKAWGEAAALVEDAARRRQPLTGPDALHLTLAQKATPEAAILVSSSRGLLATAERLGLTGIQLEGSD